MDETPQVAWFYTREGDRLGPVTFDELRSKAQEAALNPRLDMVWTQGMEAWKPSGEIEGLFEKRAPAEAPESLSPSAGPYAPPQQDSVADTMSRQGGWPGARRSIFLIMTIIFPILWNIGFTFGAPFLSSQLGPEIMGFVTIGALLLPAIVATYFGLMRLVNLGMSRWWYLGHMVPILNFWVGYRSFACPAGYAYHKKMDGAGIALAIIYWLIVVLALVVLAGILAVLFGAVENPELLKAVREAIPNAQRGPAAP